MTAPAPDTPATPARELVTTQVRNLATAGPLAALVIGWAALPVTGTPAGTRLAVIVAMLSGAASVARLALGDLQLGGGAFDPVHVRVAAWLAHYLREVPWAEVMIVAVIVLEMLHHSRPWHTAVLGIVLLAWLLAMHLAESGSRPGVYRPQLPVLAAGVGLLVLAAAATALPALQPGHAAEVLRVLAIVAAVLAAGLALPLAGVTAVRRGRDNR